MGIVQVGVILGGNFPGRNCPGGSYPWWEFSGWELSGWELSWVGIFFGGSFPGGNYSVKIIRVGVFMLPTNDISCSVKKFKFGQTLILFFPLKPLHCKKIYLIENLLLEMASVNLARLLYQLKAFMFIEEALASVKN